ncbi:uroporphyrinogen-III synthase [Pelagibacterium limicola]|uniref:uroporphyrinogen-III synthase n=1 Tax=Pelagibacterium limicola TaxID=2791022 RepID=UPI0018AFEAF1|nr:uroporphyrinogen-III synthase [Pelagibacterium limicola]
MSGRIKLLVTRPEPDATRTAAHLAALDLEPVVAPMLEAIAQSDPLPEPETFFALAATSVNAVRFLADRNPHPAFFKKPLYAVGEATADAARDAGFDMVSAAEGTLADLVALIVRTHRGGPIFHPAARDLSGSLGAALKPHSIDVLVATLYAMEQVPALPAKARAELVAGEIAGALFFSRRTAEAFARLATGPDFILPKTMLHCLCLSENCAEPLVEHHFLRIALADHPSHEAMMALALAFARDQIRA